MNPETQILFVDVAATDTMLEAIAQCVAELEGDPAALPGSHVSVEYPTSVDGGECRFRVRVHVLCCVGEPVIGQGEDRDPQVALQQAFDVAQWQLDERPAPARMRRLT